MTQLIAITLADTPVLALMHFVLGNGREATPVNVEAEIVRAGLADRCVRWRLVAPEDLPASRQHRNRWRDTGTAIEIAPEVTP